MQVLRDIIKRSSYQPQSGLKGVLYKLAKDNTHSNESIKERSERMGKIKQLRSVNRNLKESLLDSILTMSLYTFQKALRNRIRLLKKTLQTRILLYTGSKIAGTKLAIDTVVIAEKNQDYEVVHTLCRELINQFSRK